MKKLKVAVVEVHQNSLNQTKDCKEKIIISIYHPQKENKTQKNIYIAQINE